MKVYILIWDDSPYDFTVDGATLDEELAKKWDSADGHNNYIELDLIENYKQLLELMS